MLQHPCWRKEVACEAIFLSIYWQILQHHRLPPLSITICVPTSTVEMILMLVRLLDSSFSSSPDLARSDKTSSSGLGKLNDGLSHQHLLVSLQSVKMQKNVICSASRGLFNAFGDHCIDTEPSHTDNSRNFLEFFGCWNPYGAAVSGEDTRSFDVLLPVLNNGHRHMHRRCSKILAGAVRDDVYPSRETECSLGPLPQYLASQYHLWMIDRAHVVKNCEKQLVVAA